MYACVSVCMYMYISFSYISVYDKSPRTSMQKFASDMYVCACVRTYVCMRVCMHVCMFVCMYVSMCVCRYVKSCVCLYIIPANSHLAPPCGSTQAASRYLMKIHKSQNFSKVSSILDTVQK